MNPWLPRPTFSSRVPPNGFAATLVQHMPLTEPPHTAPAGPPTTPAAPAVAELAALIGTHQHMVWRYLRLLGADPHEADDLMQDTFRRVGSPSTGPGPPGTHHR
jgi:hypothetical protein